MITPLLRQTSHCSIVSLIPPLLSLLNCKNYSRWIYPHFDHQLSWHSPRLLYQICHGLSPNFRWSTVYSVCVFFCLHEITCSSLCSWWHLRCSRKKCTLSYQSPRFTQLKYIKMPNCSCLITFYGMFICMFYGTFNLQCYFPRKYPHVSCFCWYQSHELLLPSPSPHLHAPDWVLQKSVPPSAAAKAAKQAPAGRSQCIGVR